MEYKNGIYLIEDREEYPNLDRLTDEEFIRRAKLENLAYSLRTFQDDFNRGNISPISMYLRTFPKDSDTLAYLVNSFELKDEEFRKLALKQCTVYSLAEFEQIFNAEGINPCRQVLKFF